MVINKTPLKTGVSLDGDSFFNKYKKIYEKQFNSDLKDDVFNHWISRGDKFLTYMVKSELLAFLKYSYLDDIDPYSLLVKKERVLHVASLASIEKGKGAMLLEELIKIAKTDKITIILVPSDDELIPYYKKFGFKTIYPEDEELPSVVMVKYF